MNSIIFQALIPYLTKKNKEFHTKQLCFKALVGSYVHVYILYSTVELVKLSTREKTFKFLKF